MTGTPLTPEAIAIAVKPLALLPNAPALDEALYAALLGIFRSENVTCEELAAAILDVLKTETFWPGPAAILERVRDARVLTEDHERRLVAAQGTLMRSSSNALLSALATHDHALHVRIAREMSQGDYAQDVAKRLGLAAEVRAVLDHAGIPYESKR